MPSFFDKFKKGTRSRFNKPTTTTVTVPTPVEPTVPARDVPNKPKEHDAKAKEDQPLDETLVPDERPVRDQRSKADPKAKEGQAETEPHTTTTATVGSENIYQIAWRSEANYRMTAEHYPETNTYVPSCIALFSLLEAAESRINMTKYIQQHEPTYNPYAVKVYYAYMYYIQILRARRESGYIEGYENSLLKRFETKYPMNTLPCAEIVYGYFNTIIATELAEAKYDWIVPRIAITGAGKPSRTEIHLHETTTTTGAAFLQPSLPHMMAVLNSFINHDPTTLPTHMEDGDTYIPVFTNPAAHGDINMFDATLQDNTNNVSNLKALLATPGLSSPMRFGNENYPAAARHARRTDFGRDINIVVNTTHANARARLVQDATYTDLDSFLMMTKSSNLRFFSYLRDNAVIFSRFQDQVYHFSDVQTVGGLETTVLCQLKLNDATTRRYADTNVGIGQSFTWYPQQFSDLIAGFATNRAGIRRNEELQAFSYGTNATLPIAIPADLREGPFWRNTEWIQTMFHDDTHATMTRTGKPMYTNHTSMVLSCFRDKPHGTGIVDNMFE